MGVRSCGGLHCLPSQGSFAFPDSEARWLPTSSATECLLAQVATFDDANSNSIASMAITMVNGNARSFADGCWTRLGGLVGVWVDAGWVIEELVGWLHTRLSGFIHP